MLNWYRAMFRYGAGRRDSERIATPTLMLWGAQRQVHRPRRGRAEPGRCATGASWSMFDEQHPLAPARASQTKLRGELSILPAQYVGDRINSNRANYAFRGERPDCSPRASRHRDSFRFELPAIAASVDLRTQCLRLKVAEPSGATLT